MLYFLPYFLFVSEVISAECGATVLRSLGSRYSLERFTTASHHALAMISFVLGFLTSP